jgi:hypothetical protein
MRATSYKVGAQQQDYILNLKNYKKQRTSFSNKGNFYTLSACKGNESKII